MPSVAVNCFSEDGEGEREREREREIIARQRPPFGWMDEERRKEAGCWSAAGRLLAAGSLLVTCYSVIAYRVRVHKMHAYG